MCKESRRNRFKREAEIAEKKGKKAEKSTLETKAEKTKKNCAKRQFEKEKTKSKKTHKRRINGDVVFETMKKIVTKKKQEKIRA